MGGKEYRRRVDMIAGVLLQTRTPDQTFSDIIAAAFKIADEIDDKHESRRNLAKAKAENAILEASGVRFIERADSFADQVANGHASATGYGREQEGWAGR